VVDVVLLLDVDVLVLVLDEVEVLVTVLLVDVELLDEVDVLVLEVVTEDVELLVDVVFVEEVLVLTEVDVVVLELVLVVDDVELVLDVLVDVDVVVVVTQPEISACTHPPALQVSVVHGLPSSAHALPFGSAAVQESEVSLHDSAQLASPSGPGHGSPECTHDPPLQVSTPLQKSPSSQDTVLFRCVQVPAPLHTSVVQTLPSL